MEKEQTKWTLRVSPEHTYLYVLEKAYADIDVRLSETGDTVLLDSSGKIVKGAGKAVSAFLQGQNVSPGKIKSATDIIGLRPQQMGEYASEEPSGIDVAIAVAKIRKWLFEGPSANKLPENVLQRLCLVHDKYQPGFCSVTGSCSVPLDRIKHVSDFYRVVVRPGTVESIIDHPQADSLFIENVDFQTEKRTVVSGLKGKFDKDMLLNATCLFVLNLAPVGFKGTKSFGMILFVKDEDPEEKKGTIIRAAPSSSRVQLAGYPLRDIIPFPVDPNNCTRKTLETFFAGIHVENEKLVYAGMEIVGGAEDAIKVEGVNRGKVS